MALSTKEPRLAPGRELVQPKEPLSHDGPLSSSQVAHFYEQGYVIARNLLHGELLSRVLKAKPRIQSHFPPTATYDRVSFRLWDIDEAFLQVASDSPLSRAAAQLTPRFEQKSVQNPNREMVVLKDTLFTLKGSQRGCNFHVDDPFFWPCPQGEPGPGVNIWVALDEVREDGGGLAIAPGSFNEKFLDCRKAIQGGETCLIHEIAPEKAKRLEDIAVAPKMNVGDAIIHTRYLFHRGNPFVASSSGEKGEGITRYSVRYMPGCATLQEILLEDGKLNYRDPAILTDADPRRFPTAIF